MRRLTSHVIVALITFTVGVAVASIRLDNSRPLVPPAEPAEALPKPKPFTPVTVEEIVRNRDLSLYDRGGEHGCAYLPYTSEVAACDKSTSRARDFIRKHWRERRRGYVTVRLLSEDTFDVAHFFVEPDARGEWHVELRLVRDDEHVGDWDLRAVGRRRAGRFDTPPPGTLMLVLKDKDGKTVLEL